MTPKRPSPSKSSQALSLVVVIAILGVLVAGVTVVKRSSRGVAAGGNRVGAVTSRYSNGTYEATATYGTPAGVQPIKVKLTLSNGGITSITTTPGAESAASKQYEAAFMRGYKQLVVGKTIGGLELARVSGASLTTKGFNRAIDQIRNQAQGKS